MLLAQQIALGGLGLVQWLILVIVIAGIIGIFSIVIKQMGWNIPPWLVQIFWILAAVILGVLAIKVLISLL